ncbi:MAG: hypothetical protein ABIQ04_03215 [Candidatus Saccharimonadales bacterium]
MSEFNNNQHETESRYDLGLDKNAILIKLLEIADELGIDMSDFDPEDLLGEDDNDFLGNLTTLSYQTGIDHEEFFQMIGIPVEQDM